VTAPEAAETAVARLTAALRDLLAHPQPGQAAWMQARDRAARELRDALNAALAERPSLRLAGGGSQPSSRHPAAETAYRLVTVGELREWIARLPDGMPVHITRCSCHSSPAHASHVRVVDGTPVLRLRSFSADPEEVSTHG
jgi:hypothetical protein